MWSRVGNLSCWLAEKVGPTGCVVAVDNNEQQLIVAQKRAKSKNLHNIVFEQADAHDLSRFDNQFDIVYCRWLLVHLQNPDLAVESMARAVRMRGYLACEIGDMKSTFYYPDFPRYDFLCQKLQALLKKAGNDTQIAFKLCKTLTGFSFNANISQTVLDEPDEACFFTVNFSLVLDSVTDALLDNQLLTKGDIVQLQDDLGSHVITQDTLIFLARMMQVHCQRLQ